MKTATVKDLLKEGKSAEDLIKDLEAEIEEAKRQIAADEEKLKEKKIKEEYLNSCREDVAATMLDYYIALGVIKEEDVTDDDIEKLAKDLKKIEPYVKTTKLCFRDSNSVFKLWDRLI